MSSPLADVRAALRRAPQTVVRPEARRAAVAAIFTADRQLLLIRRATRAGDPWSGHLSFPGGHAHEHEPLVDAARRETLEEIALNLDNADMLGQLDDVSTAPGLPARVVRPYVFAVEAIDDLHPDPTEVASVHHTSLDALLRGAGRSVMTHPWRTTQITLPKVDIAGADLWGMTLMIVDDLLDRIDDGDRRSWFRSR